MKICHPKLRRRGITLVECVVLMLVLSIVSVAAGVGLQSVSRGPGVVEDKLWTSQQIISRMESLRDTSYASLVSGSATSEANYKGATSTLTWIVTEIDPAFPTSTPPVAKADSGLKQIVVSMNGQSVTTWVSR